MRRVRLIRQSRDFNKARSLKPNNPERKVLFKRARERYDFSEYALHSYSTKLRHSWLSRHIDSNTAQKLVTRAYKAVERILFGQSNNEDWRSAELRLHAALRAATETQASTGRTCPSSFGRCPEVEPVAAKVLTEVPKSQDVVGLCREPGRGYNQSDLTGGRSKLRTSSL